MGGDWPACAQDNCTGACVGDVTRCLAHAGVKERDAVLRQFSKTGSLDVRGVTISDALFKEILDAAPLDADGHWTFSAARFNGATFRGEASFTNATFEGGAWFTDATFEGDAGFDKAKFRGEASFEWTTFEGSAWFGKAKFRGEASFHEATFGSQGGKKGGAWFTDATFGGNAEFDGARFGHNASFEDATFEGDALFHGARFKGTVMLARATFEVGAWFGEATFERDANARFDGARFEGEAGFAGATFEAGARFAEATFNGNASFAGRRLRAMRLIWMERNSLRRPKSRQILKCLLAAEDGSWAGFGLTCAVRTFVWTTRTCPCRRCLPAPPTPVGVENALNCSLFSEPMSQD